MDCLNTKTQCEIASSICTLKTRVSIVPKMSFHQIKSSSERLKGFKRSKSFDFTFWPEIGTQNFFSFGLPTFQLFLTIFCSQIGLCQPIIENMGGLPIINYKVVHVPANTTYQKASGQSYEASMVVIYDSRVVPDLKIPHNTTLES